jgi:DNA helicase-2/ATP-dependent DNA helicase PcrA
MRELNNDMEEIKEQLIVTEKEKQKEGLRLEKCIEVIQENIDKYREELRKVSSETKELYDNYRSDNPELHNELSVGLDLKSQIERALAKHYMALKKPYFGRVDYVEHEEEKTYSIYLGKNGINRNGTDILIVDWRAPISSVYYDSEIGESSYSSPYGDTIPITLNLKRTFEITDGRIMNYYDTDVIANDEFLTKYLSKNKEVVLGEIIATIQKEQNEIIRDTPWHSMIVQGVAGSGKTTVAMHRISYILYNYKDKFRSDEMYIIGSNKMLLNYITGVLPNLDVYNINQMTLEEFFITLLGKDFNIEKGKYKRSSNFTTLNLDSKLKLKSELQRYKGSDYFIKALECYMDQYEKNSIKTENIIYHDVVLYSEEEIKSFLSIFAGKPLQEKINLLNKRLAEKIRLKNEREDQEKEVIREEIKKYKEYFGSSKIKLDLMEFYKNFLTNLIDYPQNYPVPVPTQEILELLVNNLANRIIDVYDIGMLNYIKKTLIITESYDFVSHIIVDEAQDFGVSVFYIMKRLFPECTFTIMGDVSQNINYDTGMNDWETLKTEIFQPDKDKFYVLAKSYRNTVEISNYAGRVLKHCTFKTYDIEPVIRHGKEISITRLENDKAITAKTVEILKENLEQGFTTVAVICRTIEETVKVQELLGKHITIQHSKAGVEEMTYTNGIMVLPIHMTKGLEFDSVILWNPDDINYKVCDADAKLLYVAITRALHEFFIVYKGNLSGLLE